MAKIIIYTMNYCPYCEAAKRLFASKGLAYEEIKLAEDDDDAWLRLEKRTGFKTMPQIFVGEKFIGGFTELQEADRDGELDRLTK